MKYLIFLLFILSVGAITTGLIADLEYSEKLVGYGVAGLFFIVFPLFSWHRWKNKDVKDYLLTKENLDKMREREKRNN
ncbi:hypothetical protein [Hanstruepera ponticola]|uniref:hypothetical protein n=1 Tax=Hanstruepera ponticola TaxID=2042995 RepID=UPI000CF0E7DD|nr:hypothetical protein [Hanstruepera ponticola]